MVNGILIIKEEKVRGYILKSMAGMGKYSAT
jgi:hypothetical protein